MALHPTIQELEQLARGLFGEPEAESVRSHLESCAECRAQFEACLANQDLSIQNCQKHTPSFADMLAGLRAAGLHERISAAPGEKAPSKKILLGLLDPLERAA